MSDQIYFRLDPKWLTAIVTSIVWLNIRNTSEKDGQVGRIRILNIWRNALHSIARQAIGRRVSGILASALSCSKNAFLREDHFSRVIA